MAKSKVAQAKYNAGWRKRGLTCGNCKHFRSVVNEVETSYGMYKKEKMMRCRLFAFATRKSAWCENHERQN